jgi:murein L,D-transpeptidase YcbB/YkuD
VDLRDAVARDRLAATIDAAEPAFPQYGRFKRLLAHYRDLAALPTIVLPPLASPRSKIVEGDAYSGVPALRAQLVRLGDLAADSEWPTNDRYTGALVDAVRRFQGRHGLQTDGVLGKDTLAALNVPLTTRLTQITLSLERLRWLPQLPPGPLIAINIPSFQLWAFADASDLQHATLSMAVVVGRAMRTETPVFIGEMRLVEFSPYWNVPRSILRNELLPRIASDATYLEREAMEVVSVSRDGRTYAAVDSTTIAALRSGEARLRQRPGPRNALGGVKFGLANTMDIYLHATPASELFERTRRDFSHGCIRVREPEALAQFVLQGRREWTAAEIEAAMTSGVNRTVPLAAPFPVIVFYTTAIVDVDGRALFLADVYGHDRKLLDALRGGARVAR